MRSSTLILSLSAALFASAQWPTVPDDPLVVCNASNGQSGVRAMSDGSGGWLVAWSDKRTDNTNAEIYGQHYDPNGNMLWTDNGKTLVSLPGETVYEMAWTLLENGNLLIAYLHRPPNFQDTLSAMAYDMNGDPVWSSPTHVTGPGTSILGQDNLTVVATDDRAYIGWYDTYSGGSTGVNVTLINADGSLPWGPDGFAVPNASYGPFVLFPDLAGGVIVNWRCGNGSGTCLYAQRVDTTGTTAWTTDLGISSGGPGLSYAFNTRPDGTGGFVSAWAQVGADIAMARWDTTGSLVWTPSPFFACNESHGQDNPVVVENGGDLFIAWGDNRPPASNQDLYVQKFDLNGTPQWTADGVQAINTNTYIPTPGLVPSDEGAVIATFDGNILGFCAMRVLNNGSLDWPSPTAFCIPSFNPFYGDQVKLADGAGGVVAFWSNQNDVYAARIYENGELGDHTSVAEIPNPGDELGLRPSPTAGPFSVALSDQSQLHSVRVIDVQGRAALLPSTRNNNRLQLDASSLANGVYTLELVTDAGVSTDRFIIAR
jgi:hypothetical protein